MSSKEFKSTCPESAATHKTLPSPTFFEKKRQSARARGEEGRETRTNDSKSERRIEWRIYLRVRVNIYRRDLAFVVSLLCLCAVV